ncbi:hypothetical protein DSO57_1035255 [Entomophthora muscae]|uniref:Uncharacterized protein n=1 Tax=Entomophthora muscae TaxID=34485 RepID=A0ACC2TLQ7_9FUNG|nr:hypothetical protein DSO57_1035255 [Entomophthora muscae]
MSSILKFLVVISAVLSIPKEILCGLCKPDYAACITSFKDEAAALAQLHKFKQEAAIKCGYYSRPSMEFNLNNRTIKSCMPEDTYSDYMYTKEIQDLIEHAECVLL